MEQLFDLLIDNPFILIAVIAFFASMLKGKKAVPGMPTFSGEPDQDAKDAPVELTQEEQQNGRNQQERYDRHYETHEIPTSAKGVPDAYRSEVYTEHKARNYKLEEGDSFWDDTSLNKHSSLEEQEIGGSGQSDTKISVADARQGVIWAEILGPPRAKRPLHK